ncbi:MAG TPA: RNA pyrophosphohydrolase [bacterium]|nr:RNA pyrophosphohydrolase [bacterium]
MNLRPNVALIVIDGAGKILIGERTDIAGAWQLPQGGIDTGEEAETAAWRELAEETGLTPAEVTLAGKSGPFSYRLPNGAVVARGFAGQEQTYFLFRLTAPTATLRPNDEFRAFRWEEPAAVLALAVDFKRPCYAAAFRELFGETR